MWKGLRFNTTVSCHHYGSKRELQTSADWTEPTQPRPKGKFSTLASHKRDHLNRDICLIISSCFRSYCTFLLTGLQMHRDKHFTLGLLVIFHSTEPGRSFINFNYNSIWQERMQIIQSNTFQKLSFGFKKKKRKHIGGLILCHSSATTYSSIMFSKWKIETLYSTINRKRAIFFFFFN